MVGAQIPYHLPFSPPAVCGRAAVRNIRRSSLALRHSDAKRRTIHFVALQRPSPDYLYDMREVKIGKVLPGSKRPRFFVGDNL